MKHTILLAVAALALSSCSLMPVTTISRSELLKPTAMTAIDHSTYTDMMYYGADDTYDYFTRNSLKYRVLRTENAMPAATAARTVTTTISTGVVSAGRNRMARAPPSAPTIIMPSKPMLMIPECSEKQPPNATKSSTEAKIRVYCTSKLIFRHLPFGFSRKRSFPTDVG